MENSLLYAASNLNDRGNELLLASLSSILGSFLVHHTVSLITMKIRSHEESRPFCGIREKVLSATAFQSSLAALQFSSFEKTKSRQTRSEMTTSAFCASGCYTKKTSYTLNMEKMQGIATSFFSCLLSLLCSYFFLLLCSLTTRSCTFCLVLCMCSQVKTASFESVT